MASTKKILSTRSCCSRKAISNKSTLIWLSGQVVIWKWVTPLVTSNPKRTKRMSFRGSECRRPEKPWPDGQEIDLRRKINLKRAMIQMGIGQDTCLGPRFCFAKNTTSTRCQCTLYFHTRTILIDTSQVLFLALSL